MTENNDPLIKLEGLRKVFYTDEMETHALADVYLEINRGEFVEVMGPSGCGKSSLLAIIGLLDTPSAGEYWPSDVTSWGIRTSHAAEYTYRLHFSSI